MEQQDITNISLIDNTVPPELQQQDPDLFRRTSTTLSRSSSTRRWSRPSVRGELQKRKYAKWQPHKLGITDDAPGGNGNNGNGNGSGNGSGQDSRRMSLVDARRWSTTDGLSTGESGPSSPSMNASVDATDFGSDGIDNIITNGTNANGNANRQQPNGPDSTKPTSELDILYENQRGWFLFGIPLYSHSSLLNFDPSAWVTRNLKDSPVNITNAQLPDPSWEWAWQTWYVDMSSDVDEQGWQYSFSFSSSAWHGSHPWFHSFVRRRRWVRLRVKRASMERYRGRTGFEEAHMLTADYFTIHSGRRKRVSSVADMSRVPSTYTSGQGPMDEVPPLEEIGNIPTLMYALKSAIVDREKIDALKRFIDDGGDEIYYLDEKIPEIMSVFVFQTSRWQFLTHLLTTITDLSQLIPQKTGKQAIELQRKQENLAKAAEAIRNNITGPELVADHHHMLDLTPISKSKEGSLLSKRSSIKVKDLENVRPVGNGGVIKGIPKEAEVGREGHIYQYTS
ncbi:uncharacterized protein ASPGLDRAFT_123810 [Aspergillus glaucus CBS 516.65]|uniref:Peroxin/Ferlin domain-containing protein n=1 Tax=Aspergillus glaucus CBS 516.65 TaxID=1160497 RepID=A0A1L9VPF6_ASPGL|nr:hypothetical protein ASPGLDRAFT_123810 [Aspergillus glaucus CBS 516.65]OJJ85772.1 hypothetical protein ASPGLDRAFT_123810 [Aspergillus glaucus CBS 516.65]